MAGIVSNLVLAAISTLVLAVLTKVDSLGALPAGVANVLFLTFQMAILINLVLAFFNLLPIPPLDGSHVVAHILPEGVARRYRDFGQYGILALMGIIYFVPGALGVALSPVYFLSSAANWFVELWI